jgi:hypothetical protein
MSKTKRANNTLTQLEETYADLLHTGEWQSTPAETTFFDIAGFPHYERVISNFYAYYLNPEAAHGLGDLFLSSLHALILEKQPGKLILADTINCYIEQEVLTSNGKLIDLVVHEPTNDGKKTKNAIIIENKVYAHVYNDLTEYYNHIKAKKKIGVVLSLKPITSLPRTYICITHQELINRVEDNLADYDTQADQRQRMILNDFMTNLKNMKASKATQEQYTFFFKHTERIKEIVGLYESIRNDLFHKVELVCDQLEMELLLDGRFHSKLRYFKSPVAPVQFVIWMQDFFEGKGNIYISVELPKAGIARLDEVNRIRFSKKEESLKNETTKKRESYLHYASLNLEPSNEELLDLNNYLCQHIVSSGLKDVFLKIEKVLSTKKAT